MTYPDIHCSSSQTAIRNCFVPSTDPKTCAATSHSGIRWPFSKPRNEARRTGTCISGNGFVSVLNHVISPSIRSAEDLRDEEGQHSQGSQDRKLLIHSQTFDDRTIRILRELQRREAVEERDGGRFGEHVIDCDEDGLNGVDPLEFSEEIDVELGILLALGCEHCRALGDGLDEGVNEARKGYSRELTSLLRDFRRDSSSAERSLAR